jgi:hypothetical protein
MRVRNPAGKRFPAAITAAAGITILAMTGAPAIAATAPHGKPTLPASAASAAPAHTAPAAHAPMRKPASRGARADTHRECIFLFLESFTTSATTVATGTAVTLTATVSCDIGPTPYWQQIFDTTTGALVGNCAFGTTCTATVSQSVAGTHDYVAYIDGGGSTPPPSANPGSTAVDNAYVTWEAPPDDFSVSMSGPSEIGWESGPGTYSAYVNQDVGPTPYYIEIFNETTDTLLAACGIGIECTISYTPPVGTAENLVAFVSGYSAALPPAAIQASSNVLQTIQQENIP